MQGWQHVSVVVKDAVERPVNPVVHIVHQGAIVAAIVLLWRRGKRKGKTLARGNKGVFTLNDLLSTQCVLLECLHNDTLRI